MHKALRLNEWFTYIVVSLLELLVFYWLIKGVTSKFLLLI